MILAGVLGPLVYWRAWRLREELPEPPLVEPVGPPDAQPT